jgi:hypothetical protein
MASRKGKTPTPKADTKAGIGAGIETVTGKKGDFVATNATQREWLKDVEDLEIARDVRRTFIRASIRRPDDLLVADVRLYNLKIVAGAKVSLKRVDAGEEALLVLDLPPQSFGEEAYLEDTGPEVEGKDDEDFKGEPGFDNKNTSVSDDEADGVPAPGETRIRISGPTRLAFVMPDDVTSLPYTVEALLNAARTWPQRRSLSAVADLYTRERPEREDKPFGSALNAVLKTQDFANTVKNVRRLLVELKTSAQNEKRTKSLESIAKQYEDISKQGKIGADGNWEFNESVAGPVLSALVAPHRPSDKVTALELPFRLITSPINNAKWAHRTGAPLRNGRHELWHTRLTTDDNNSGPDSPSRIRAIWSDDYIYPNLSETVNAPFRMPLDGQDRRMLVQLTSGYGENTRQGTDYVPKSVRANRVILSALGGLLDSEGSWNDRPASVDLQQWRHQMSLGRDHYVRVVYSGFLLPFGHAASLIKVTERKFVPKNENEPLKNRVAALRQRFFIVVREPVRTFDGTRHESGGHNFPFTSVEILTRVTPNLEDPEQSRADDAAGQIYDADSYTGGLTPRQVFWPMVELRQGGDFKFDLAATDRDGKRITFSMPLLFMSEVANTQEIKHDGDGSVLLIENVRKAYNIDMTGRRNITLGGVNVCFAPPDPNSAGDPRFPTHTMTMRVTRTKTQSATLINAYPEMSDASIELVAAQRILGKQISPVGVYYSPNYTLSGFGRSQSGNFDNMGEVFLRIKGTPFQMNFGGDAGESQSDIVGAVASPTTTITGISRKLGLASDLNAIEKNVFDPREFLGDARILGSIKLADVLPRFEGELNGDGAPKFTTREIPASGGQPARTEVQYDWQTTLSGMNQGLLLHKADGSASRFRLRATTVTVVGDPDSATTTTDSTIKNFKVNLFGFVVLWFRELNYKSTKGQKPVVRVDMHPTRSVMFGGPLEFVNDLRHLLPGDGFSDPSALSVTGNGIEAKYTLSIPNVQIGVFDVSGLCIGARFALPFDVRPMEVAFFFGERHNPFSLTVSLLGGGGFVSIGVGADGVREIEAAIEAGARCALDLGVASGVVDYKLGIYFNWVGPSDESNGLVQLTGYARLFGELEVMCLISISVTFYLGLNFTKTNGEAVIWGEASITVEVEVLVFSGEVTVRCRREFIGSDADPKFAQLIPASNTWSSYCSAFAEA